MSAEIELRALLIAAPAVNTLVSQRIAVDRIEQGSARPFVVFTRTGTERTKGLDGTVHAVLVTFSLQCWADTRAAAESFRKDVEDHLDRSKLEFIDETWRDVVPTLWQRRLRGSP